MVLGTPTTGMPLAAKRAASPMLPSPPTATSASSPSARKLRTTSSERSAKVTSPVGPFTGKRNGSARLVVPRMVPPRSTMASTWAGVSRVVLLGSSRPAYPVWMP